MMGGIINSLANPNQNQTTLVNGCSTGNCTFPMTNGVTHSTIGMCSKCIDITSELQGNGTQASLAGPSINYNTLPYVDMTLPNDLLLQSGWGDGRGGVLNASGEPGESLPHALRFHSILSQVEDHDFTAVMPASILNWTMIATSGSDMPNIFLSTACSVYSCMRHYAGLVDRGEFKETLVSTVPALHILPTMRANNFSDHGFYAGINASCIIDGNTYDLTRIRPNQIGISQNGSVFLILGGGNLTLPSQCINEIDSGRYVVDLASFLTHVLTGSCSMMVPGPPCSRQWWLQGLWNSGNATLDTVQTTFNSVVESITKRIRIQGYDPMNSTQLVYGTVIQTTTCIAFSWGWMLFPALLIILTVICLVITMAQPIYGVEKPLWKSSILPLLYASPGTQLMASGEARDMEARSKITVARLEKSEDKWSFYIQ